MTIFKHEKLQLHDEKNIHMSSKIYDKNGYNLDWGFANHLVLIACFKS